MTSSDIHKKAMIDALEKSLGIVTIACKSVGMSRQTHYRWLKEDPEYAKSVKDIEDITLDFGESQLHMLMRDKNPAAVIFFLKTKGKGRGYVESQEVVTYNPDKAPSWLDGSPMAPDQDLD